MDRFLFQVPTLRDTPRIEHFVLQGQIVPLRKSASVADQDGYVPRRRLGGWIMTYGKIGPDGGIIPTTDREGQVMEAARELGHIDWSNYLTPRFEERHHQVEETGEWVDEWVGHWNDTHDAKTLVGVPESLEFHDGSTNLSREHGKVGFWTTGHLWDREDPQSWTRYTDYVPDEAELAKADFYWGLAELLDGYPRPLGFSAHGRMALSPCRKRVLAAWVDANAVAQVPVNPDATAEMLKSSPLAFIRKGMVGDNSECGSCQCPAGSCTLLRKGRRPHKQGDQGEPSGDILAGADPHDDEADPGEAFVNAEDPKERLLILVQRVAKKFRITEPQALKWIKLYFAEVQEKESHRGTKAH